ncbi:uncharacterized protein KD926_003804 [Aspergillus affinis]|uniref:uncharacterized protein n=1 Tax=Aspergillus affinis TaxID=1070780 RepID=UPI0022FDFC4F|nr:uncharacterized protein KD926_003804 [Aspergillus affinis]KAI9043274.1 hypothetical protein KD926_003804 [Aspergillus affinis]
MAKTVMYRLALLNLGAKFASDVCERYHDNDCVWWIKEIQWVVNGIFAIAVTRGRVEGSSGVSTDQERTSIDARSLTNMTYTEMIQQSIRDMGSDYDTVEEVDIVSLTHHKRSSDEPDLMHRTIVRGLKRENTTHDVAFNHYSNGGTVLHLGGPNQALAANPSDMSKRAGFSQAGFKVSFTTRQPAALNKAQKNDMAHAIAVD